MKIKLLLILLMLPIVVISFKKKETNFILKKIKDNSSKSCLVEEKITIINNNKSETIPLNDYIYGVVASEMPASFNYEALKAQAIVSRSYILARCKTNNCQVGTNTDYQVYNDEDTFKTKWGNKYNEYHQKIKKAVLETDNMVITYDDEIIEAFYFSMSNGYTEKSDSVFSDYLPYIKSVKLDESLNNNYEKTVELSINDFKEKLNISGHITIKDIIRNETNRVTSININNKKFSGVEIRKLLNLRSTDFEINVINNLVNIKTRGYGHGVGMSQYGANQLANDGANYIEIINFYYNNVLLNKI